MTVSTTNITSGPYTGNGVTTAFSYTFRVEDKTQLVVYETTDAGIETLLTVDTDYTVGSIGNDAGGLVTRVAGALPSGYTWYIRSAYAETQLTAFASQGAFFPAVHESAFDKLTFLLQQIRDSSSRALSLSDSYSGAASTVMPTPAALKFLRWDATGLALESVSGTEGLGIASDVSFTPAGSISSTNVQSAIQELDTSAAKVDEDLVYTGASFKILADTTDGSDNKWIQIAGGGAGTTSRGAVLTLDGDETSGDFFLESGDSGDGNVTTGGTLTLTGTTAVNISSSGTLALTATTAVTVPTASPGTNSTVAASTAYTDAAVAAAASKTMHVQDQKASGTPAGGATASTIHTRDLNTVLTNTITGASLASNKITLPAGTYDVRASVPMFRHNAGQAFLYNTTDAAYTLVGQSCFSSSAQTVQTHMLVVGRFTIAGTKDFEVRHYAGSTIATDGLGNEAGSGQVEVYTDIQIWKIA